MAPRRRTHRPRAVLLRPDEIEKMRVVGRLACRILDQVEKMIIPGMTTGEIDRVVDEMTREAGAVSAPFQYLGGGSIPFPGHCCTSVNNVICHGIPSHQHVLREGDIINVDVTPKLEGYHGDTSRTFLVGAVAPQVQRLVEDTFEAMRRGIAAVKPGNRVGDIGHAVQSFAEPRGHSVVRRYAGHGIGAVFHGLPTISHIGRPGTGEPFVPGMTFTVEPMLNTGDWRDVLLDDGWTVLTADGSLSAQFEHTVTVTETGVEILTLPDDRALDLSV